MSLNPYLARVRARTCDRATWQAAPSWVRRQSIYGAWLDSDSAARAVTLSIVAKYRAGGAVRQARWYIESVKAGPAA